MVASEAELIKLLVDMTSPLGSDINIVKPWLLSVSLFVVRILRALNRVDPVLYL